MGLTLTEALRRLGMTHEPCTEPQPWASGRRTVRHADGTVWMHGTAAEVWEAVHKAERFRAAVPEVQP